MPRFYETTLSITNLHNLSISTHVNRSRIKYYSFKNDVVLDPFAGTGTTGKAAAKLGRRFALLEQDPNYMQLIKKFFSPMTKSYNIDWVNVTIEDNPLL